MKLKRESKFGEKFTCRFKIDIYKEFDKFWCEHSEVSKISTLMASFWAKYILLELKKYREVIFHKTEEGYKIWRVISLSFQNWHKEFDIFWPEHSKVSKNFTLGAPSEQILYSLRWKSTEELSFMKLKRESKFGEKFTCRFKIDIKNLTNFDVNTWKSQKFSL